MVVAEVLTGIALVKQSVDFIKSNIETVNDIRGISDQIENLFVGEEQVQKARSRKAGAMGLGDQFNIKNVAQEVIDARLAQEQMQQMRNLIDMRFGPGTWQTIVDLRAKRIREERAALEAERNARIRKQKEFEETMKQFVIGAVVVSFMIGSLGFVIWSIS